MISSSAWCLCMEFLKVTIFLTCLKITVSQQCGSPMALGMEDSTIEDSQITASEFYEYLFFGIVTSAYPPYDGRLNKVNGYWSTETDTPTDPWMQVDLSTMYTITGLEVQGNVPSITLEGDEEYVTELDVQYGDSPGALEYVKQDGVKKTFNASSDTLSVVAITFPAPITARYIRVLPITWQNWCSMRLEIIGCPIPETTTAVVLNTTPNPTVNTPAPTTVTAQGSTTTPTLVATTTQSVGTTAQPLSTVATVSSINPGIETTEILASVSVAAQTPTPGTGATATIPTSHTTYPSSTAASSTNSWSSNIQGAGVGCGQSDPSGSLENVSFAQYLDNLKCQPGLAGEDDAAKQGTIIGILHKFDEAIPSEINGNTIEYMLQKTTDTMWVIIADLSLTEPFISAYLSMSIKAERGTLGEMKEGGWKFQPSELDSLVMASEAFDDFEGNG
ncbi:uncharacterized protein [Amphiura filiformis]|uniref:uncharacterized protein n=1 Tax=Amphiura filiformis TaxID=82378 RepID=UPI003B214121